MKKLLSNFVAIALMAIVLVGCANEGAQTTSQEETKGSIAFISDTMGTEQFTIQAYEMAKSLAEENGYSFTSVESQDTTQWEENTRAIASEGYDLVIGLGWQAGDAFAQVADQYPDTEFAVIDTVSSNENVTSITFNETEGAYVLGAMIGAAFPNEELYGYISSFQSQATYKYRYGYEEGVKLTNTDAQFMYNFTNSYSDTSLAYEFTMQQQAAGANVIVGGISSSANFGIYQAALELAENNTPIYTTGLSVDQTTEENPYLIGGLLKNTGVCVEIVINEFMAGELNGGVRTLGLAENAFGVVHITTEDANFLNEEVMTPDAIAKGKEIAEQIISGEFSIVAPEESAQ